MQLYTLVLYRISPRKKVILREKSLFTKALNLFRYQFSLSSLRGGRYELVLVSRITVYKPVLVKMFDPRKFMEKRGEEKER